MEAQTDVSVDIRDLMTVRVVEFEVNNDPERSVDVKFQLEADKTRAIKHVSLRFGKFPDTPFEEGGSSLMSTLTADGAPKTYDQIKQDAWGVVMTTTAVNKVGGMVGTHADTTWSEIEQWVVRETEKPSMSSTLNI